MKNLYEQIKKQVIGKMEVCGKIVPITLLNILEVRVGQVYRDAIVYQCREDTNAYIFKQSDGLYGFMMIDKISGDIVNFGNGLKAEDIPKGIMSNITPFGTKPEQDESTTTWG